MKFPNHSRAAHQDSAKSMNRMIHVKGGKIQFSARTEGFFNTP
jgi:hypothetical protein